MSMDFNDVKKQALADFSEYLSPMKARTMKSAGLDIIEEKRDGASVWDITGRKYIDCQTGSGIMNVGRHNREIVQVLKEALDTYDIGVFLLCSRQKADLAKKLSEIAPGDLKCSIFGSGGGEANDAAIKLGARPGQWFASFAPVPRDKWLAIEVFEDDRWLVRPG